MVRYRSWSALFTVAIILLSALLWLRTTHITLPAAVTPTKQTGTPVPGRKTAPAARLGPRNAYNAIAERPLFARTRRPAEEEPTTSAPSARTNLPNFILKGIVISPDEKYILLLKSSSSETVRLTEGQGIDGWRVEKILSDRVILKSGDRTVEFKLWNEHTKEPKPSAKPLTRPQKFKLPVPQIKR